MRAARALPVQCDCACQWACQWLGLRLSASRALQHCTATRLPLQVASGTDGIILAKVHRGWHERAIMRRHLFNPISVCAAAAAVAAAAGGDPSLSPAAWDPADFARVAALNAAPPRAQPMAVGAGGLVAGTSNALAVYAGVFALQQGGTAMDACVATAVAEAVLCAGSYTSLAGIAHVVYVDAATGAATHYNGGWNTVRGNAAAAVPTAGVGATMLVPGFWAALGSAAADHAAFSLATLVEPARYFAAAGFPVYPELAALIVDYNATLSRTPEGICVLSRIVRRPSAGSR